MPSEDAEVDVHDFVGLGIPNLPLLVKDITMVTEISFDGKNVVYKVYLRNDMNESIGKLRVRPSIQEGMFQPDSEYKVVGPLDPGETGEVVFYLTPLEEAWHLGVEGRAIQGKDIIIHSVLQCWAGTAKFHLQVINNRNYSMKGLKVRPILPEDFVPEIDEMEIDVLGPNEKKKLEFPILTREEWETRQKHEESIRKPWQFFPEKPRRKKRNYPRTMTAEEMAEIRNKLLLAQTDEEILEHIGKTPVEEESVEEAIVIWIEEFIEEPPMEEDFEPYIEPVMPEDAIEEEFIILGITIEEISEEVPEEEDFDLEWELPIEEICEEEPIEEDFERELIREVKPLDLEGAVTEDIELEPMDL